MPELPEVEIIKKQLSDIVLNKKIISIEKSNLNLHGKPIPNLNYLKNESFIHIYRRNKYLILETKNYYLVIHLGMTGQLIYEKKLPEKQKHIHVIFNFLDSVLYYVDIRRFGTVNLFSKQDFQNYLDLPLFKNLGFEPLDKNFSIENLETSISQSNSKAKSFIMNGKFICGIGNIYACEILFLSKIHPEELINNITKQQKKDLFYHIVNVLSKAVSLGGSTISDFVHLNGAKGTMQEHYFVYGREGKKCKNCHHEILRIKQNGRGTFYCPHCQSLNK